MEIKLKDRDARLYSRLYVSGLDFDFAAYCLGVLLKKGWHCQPWERRGTIYQQQSAFTSALVIAYARPFTKSKGWPHFPSELKAFDLEESAMHKHIMELRHTIYAHSDSKHYAVIPWRTEAFSTDILTAPWPHRAVASNNCERSRSAQKNDEQAASCDPSQDERNTSRGSPNDRF